MMMLTSSNIDVRRTAAKYSPIIHTNKSGTMTFRFLNKATLKIENFEYGDCVAEN
jgi:hypothetical protein